MRCCLALLFGEAYLCWSPALKDPPSLPPPPKVETRLYQLLSQVKQINNEQAYQRTREATFREISESTNQRVLFWSIAQAIVLVLTGYWQLNHLRNFFTAKKLV